MDEKSFLVFNEDRRVVSIKSSFDEAKKEAQQMANEYGSEASILSPIAAATPDEINVRIDSYEAAIEYLGRTEEHAMIVLPEEQGDAIIAMYKLATIAEAWNKADNYVPDFSNKRQRKYSPAFKFKDEVGKFVFTYTNDTIAYAMLGSRLCFKTSERAKQFGTQFIDLWNDFLLF